MGGGRWSAESYTAYACSAASKSLDKLYSRHSTCDAYVSGQKTNAVEIGMRESRDSEDNPNSTPVIVALDVTGSMGFIAEKMAKSSLGTIVQGIIGKNIISDPHFMFMGIGDCTVGDEVPLQVTQFEADNKIIPQLTDIIIEGGGGGNIFESYDMAWHFAAYATKTDCWEKRHSQGYLFTIGDEMFPTHCDTNYMKKVLKDNYPQDFSIEKSLKDAMEKYQVFHIIIGEGNYAKHCGERVLTDWSAKIGKRALFLDNHEHISDLIISVIAITEGADPKEVVESLQNKSAMASIAKALRINCKLPLP